MSDSKRLSGWVREHSRAVRGYLLAMARREDVADDLLQEVFHRAWQARQSYRESGSARAYLMRIADRLVLDRARKAGREVNIDVDEWQRVEPSDSEAEPSDVVSKAESFRRMREALQGLSQPQRRVLLLRYYGDMAFADIAKTMGCPLNTVLSHCRRGLLTLRKRLVEVT